MPTATAVATTPHGADTPARDTEAQQQQQQPNGRHSSAAPQRPSLRSKRVAMVVYSSYPADPRPRRAVDVMLRQGMTVDLICLKDGKERAEPPAGLRVTRVPITHRRGGKLLYIYNYLAFLFVSAVVLAFRGIFRRYDLVHVHNMPDVLVLSGLVPKLLGAKVILDMHDPMPELMTTIYGLGEQSRAVRIIKRLEKWSMARAHSVVTVNLACKRIFSTRSCATNKVTVVMNSPDGEIFPFRAPRPRPAANGQDTRVIMYHGSLVERNGLDLAVAALAEVKKALPNVELRIYGRRTAYLDTVMETVSRIGLSDSVKYLGPKTLEQLVEVIADCDVGVIPNQRNAFTEINTPTRMFEYLALGKPVIAPSTPGIADYFGPGSLFFFESGDSGDLARTITHVLSHPSEALENAKRGQEVYMAHAWSQEQEVLVNLLDSLLRGNKAN